MMQGNCSLADKTKPMEIHTACLSALNKVSNKYIMPNNMAIMNLDYSRYSHEKAESRIVTAF